MATTYAGDSCLDVVEDAVANLSRALGLAHFHWLLLPLRFERRPVAGTRESEIDPQRLRDVIHGHQTI